MSGQRFTPIIERDGFMSMLVRVLLTSLYFTTKVSYLFPIDISKILTAAGVGWCKPLAYCIAFSADGAMDVTRRYCRNPIKYGKPRDKIPEAVLLFIMDEIRAKRRRDMGKEEKFRLEGEDMREVRELRHYYVSTITAEVAKLIPFPATRRLTASEEADAQKAREAAEELRLRNEAQRSHQH